MRRSFHNRVLSLFVSSLALLMIATVAIAEQGDSSLQGHVLQRTDGSIYVYKDGSRVAVQPVPLSDDDIDAIPLSGSVDRVDDLFAQATSPITTGPIALPAPAPTAIEPTPVPGTLLYQSDWSIGPNGWALPVDWQVTGSMLSSSGTNRDASDIVSPYAPPSSDYAVEAEIQATKYTSSPGAQSGFGLFARGDAHGDFRSGILDSGHTAGIRAPGALLSATRTFNAGAGWHVYRFEANGDQVRLLIDGVSWADDHINSIYSGTTPKGRTTGLWAQAAQMNVRGFRVYAL